VLGSGQLDSDLIARSFAEPALFDEVFRRHFPDVFRFAARQLGVGEGEDVAAETFARAFAGRGRFRSTGSARPWLFGICVNLVLRRHRNSRRGFAALQRLSEPAGIASAEDAVASAVDAERQRAALWTALSHLRKEEQRVLLLYALAGLSPLEISASLGLPAATVRSHLFRARRAMRSRLSDEPATSASLPPSPPACAWRTP
jgi:RNA polymerase sigma factor (sigma-70 family)